MVAGPLALLAAGVLVVVVALWALGRFGIISIESETGEASPPGRR